MIVLLLVLVLVLVLVLELVLVWMLMAWSKSYIACAYFFAVSLACGVGQDCARRCEM